MKSGLGAHSLDLDYKPKERIYDSGFAYDLKKSYGYAGVSGWSWFIYRKAPAPASPASP